MKRILVTFCLVAMFCFIGTWSFAAIIDIVEYPDGYFVDNDDNKYSDPYYRWHNEDWEWQHSAISGTWSSATLSISAFDVDNDGGANAEIDNVYGFLNGSWELIGELAGASDIWSYTTFDLTSEWYDAIASGLQVRIDIDALHEYDVWAVSLAKSVLSLDGGLLPDPEPGSNPVPEPSTALLLGTGFLGLACMRRKRA